MDITEVFADLAGRAVDAARRLPPLSPRELNAHPAGHPNSIAWLLWHSGRMVDIQLSELSGQPQQWEDFRDRFGLGEAGQSMGFGHNAEQARAITVDDQQLLLDYLQAALGALTRYAAGLKPGQFDEVIDHNWDPPVTRGVRLVSLVDDAISHVGQAAYAAGALRD